jgi:outer membrane lipoprotein-sorting protein
MTANSHKEALSFFKTIKTFLIVAILLSFVSLGFTQDAKSEKNDTVVPKSDKSKPSSQPSDPNSPAKDVKPVKMSDKELAKLLATIEKEASGLVTLKSDLTQEKHLAMFNDVIKSKGLCIFQKPDMVRLDTTAPYKSSLIAAGKKVVKYNFSNGKWVKLKLPSKDIVLMVTNQIAGWMQGKFVTKDSIYDVAAFKGRNTTITLTPKDKKLRAMLSCIELTVSKVNYRVVSVKILEDGDDFTLMRFSNELENIKLPKSIFDTRPSKPTKINIPSPPVYLKTKSSNEKTKDKK